MKVIHSLGVNKVARLPIAAYPWTALRAAAVDEVRQAGASKGQAGGKHCECQAMRQGDAPWKGLLSCFLSGSQAATQAGQVLHRSAHNAQHAGNRNLPRA